MDLGPLGLAVEVLKEEHDAALLRVLNSSLQPVDRGLPAQPHIRREVIAAMHDDPFGLEARGEIDIGPQILIGGLAQEGGDFGDVDRGEGVEAEMQAVLCAGLGDRGTRASPKLSMALGAISVWASK